MASCAGAQKYRIAAQKQILKSVLVASDFVAAWQFLRCYIEVGFLTNPDDLRILQTRRRDGALGLADGLQAWLKNTDLRPLPTPAPKPIVYPLINIQINSAPHEEKGILVNGNAFVPSEVLDVLNIKPEAVDRRIT